MFERDRLKCTDQFRLDQLPHTESESKKQCHSANIAKTAALSQHLPVLCVRG
jgi:hypothetical protein